MDEAMIMAALGAAAVVALPRLKTRFELSQAKHPSLTGHARMARRVAALLPYYEYDEARFFSCDDAPANVVTTWVAMTIFRIVWLPKSVT